MTEKLLFINILFINILFTDIFFRRLNHFGYGKENLWRYNGNDSPHEEKLERIWAHIRWPIGRCKCDNSAEYRDKYANNHCDIAQRLKNLCRSVKPSKKT